MLATFPGNDRAVMAVKSLADWTSIYSITASLPAELFRAIARSSGVHIYNDRNDTLYVNRSYLTINADGAGRRTLRLPAQSDVYDAMTEEVVAREAREFHVTLRDKETRIFRLQALRDHASTPK
jgi:hypothetical protein